MILVTGGTGLVGAHLLLKLLEKGEKVVVLKRSSSNISNTLKIFNYYSSNAQELFAKIKWLDADLFDVTDLEAAFKGVEEVYHCAALVSYLPQDAKKILVGNSTITANLINASLAGEVKKFCMVSSVASLGKEKDAPFVNETHIWKNDPNNSNYAISKYVSEMEVWRGHEEGLNITIVNPSLILGPGNWTQSSSTLFDSAYKGMPFYTSGAGGFVDVRDVVKAMILLMENNKFGERYILNSENVTFKKFFTDAALAMKKKPPHIATKPWMTQLIWRTEWVRNKLFKTKPIITKETAYAANRVIKYSNQKIKDAIGIEFIPVAKSIETFSRFYLNDVEAEQKR